MQKLVPCIFTLILLISSIHARIINGADTEFAPYVALVSGYNSEYGVTGGGSFISLSHVLTAGSLIHNMDWWYVDYGHNELTSLYYMPATAQLYPNYDPVTHENDIGILFLENPADGNMIIPVPLPELSTVPYLYEQGRVAGFGMMQHENTWIMNPVKQTGYFRRIQDNICADLLSNNQVTLNSETNYCAQDLEHEASVCHGDLGSGMMVYIDEVNTLVGIVSMFTNMCRQEYPAVFTRVYPYVAWIKETTGLSQ